VSVRNFRIFHCLNNSKNFKIIIPEIKKIRILKIVPLFTVVTMGIIRITPATVIAWDMFPTSATKGQYLTCLLAHRANRNKNVTLFALVSMVDSVFLNGRFITSECALHEENLRIPGCNALSVFV
jgi:hypothetical protein